MPLILYPAEQRAISESGFQFLLLDTYHQLWLLLREYIAGAERRNGGSALVSATWHELWNESAVALNYTHIGTRSCIISTSVLLGMLLALLACSALFTIAR